MLLYIDNFNTCRYYNGVIILYLKLIFLIIHIRDMGVNDLNQITIGCKTYKGRFNTIIIDGSNLLFTSLTSVVSRMRKENSKVIGDVKVIDSPILTQFSDIIDSATNYIIADINTFKRMLINQKNMFITIDSPKPIYKFSNGETLDLKAEEQERRKKNNDRDSIINNNIAKLKLTSDDDEQFQKLFNEFIQLDYFNNMKNLVGLSEIIIQQVMKRVKDVQFIKTVSEADLIIRALASCYNYDTVLVCSNDTDYFVLTGDLPNVYKTDVYNHRDIFYPKKIWQTKMFDTITFKDISIISTILGNDYTGKQKLMVYNIEYLRALYNVNNSFSILLNSKVKKIKPFLTNLKIEQDKITNSDELIKLCSINNVFVRSIRMYEDCDMNTDFVKYPTLDIDALYQEKLLKLCDNLQISQDNYKPHVFDEVVHSEFMNSSDFSSED